MSPNIPIKGKKGERVAVSDCHIEPLNLFIPGGGPILVPKHKAWPGQKKKKTTITVEVPLDDEDYYDAEEEEDEREQRPAAEVKCKKISQAARANSGKKNKGKVSSKSDIKKPNKAELERRDHRKLMQRIKEQEEYIAKLKAGYGSEKDESKAHDETESDADTDTDEAITTDDDGTQTSEDETSGTGANEAREKVRAMLKAIRIKAAGANGEGEGFTASEDAQLLARKEAGESFKTIAGFMRRPKKQVSKRYGELVRAGKTVETAGTDGPGEGATTDAATAGETTDAEKTTDAENDAQVPEGDFGGLFDLGGLTNALEAVAAEQAETEKKKDSQAKKSDKANKKNKNQQHKPSPASMPKGGNKKAPPKATAAEANAGGESGYEGGPEATPDNVGTRLYINQYARHLLRNQDEIPEADDKFDREDCILLALTESQLEHGRWEEIQARFANLTGRMVPVEVLKYKLGGARKPDYY